MFSQPLPIDELHSFFLKPRNTTPQEFVKIMALLSITTIKKKVERITTEDGQQFDELWDKLIDLKFFDSRGDVRRMIKNGGLFINRTQLKEQTVLSEDLFIDSGIIEDDSRLKFSVVRKGKKDVEILLGFFPI